MNSSLTPQAEIAIALGSPRWPVMRQIALSIVTRAILCIHRYGEVESERKILERVRNRWKLGNFCTAMEQHYKF